MRKLASMLAPCRLAACLLVVGLAGCVQNTTLKSPVGGDTVTCSGWFPDVNLWSHYPLCVESYVSEGYQRVP